ncbi:MAG: bifunctional hydroxymethylpyrimidine kinase/phosphomethylpyrimidine kinase [Betaproteobacteria bacterium]|nr:bifunctional hydroxymethylpyrimidine kinase/phosphomethylpyrimidine kinase [Betaproteobacteria bacterium]
MYSQVPQAPPAVLAIAASDPSGGAGIQADLLTLASMGCHPLSVLTAITVQNTSGVEELLPLDADWVADQARCILEDVPVAAFKVGVLGSVDVASAVAEVIADYPDVPLILDPVLASGRGDELAGEDLIEALREMLIPQTTILTPNTMELRRLIEDDGFELDEDAPVDQAAMASHLIGMGCEYVLVTGTHAASADVINVLYHSEGEFRRDAWPRLPGSYHGSGCTLASAVAAMLARGLDIGDAVREAQEYTWQTLKSGYRIGMGQRLPDRLFWARDAADEADAGGEDSA